MYQLLMKWFLIYAGLYCIREKEIHQTLSHHRQSATKHHCLGLGGAICIKKLSLLNVVSCRCSPLFLAFYDIIFLWLLYLAIISNIHHIERWLKLPCQTRKSFQTDFHIWYNTCNMLIDIKKGWNQLLVTTPSLFLLASPFVHAFGIQRLWLHCKL